MLKNATAITVVGFLLMFVGILTLFLNFVGVDLIFLAWLYELNTVLSFLIRLLMVIVGFVLIYVGQTNWDVEEV
ncbi:hypothetical protein QWY85_13890 [Neolewinella lacunae]|uniref:DUF378 domain-containing protein n=1 Tax=Neolewinella lacunae TaxID=1517758 RepID=A0A923T6S3_9BACT|nr:hypothetical protein [Neolewinella lacunae]MBC6993730.1 hypothetical protein [Neolewinella lacunae]MDN3635756.1 hypothetical protein [Neolewinella lacunae]